MSEFTKTIQDYSSNSKVPESQIRNNFQYNLFPILNVNMLNPQNLKYEIEYPNYNLLYINYLFQNFLLTQNQKFENEKKIKNEEVENNNNILLGKKKRRSGRLCTECPHKFSPHYAKGMCSNCYHSKGRSKKPWKCSHVNKAHYALGLCQNCYQMAYIKKQNLSLGKIKLTEKNNNVVDNDIMELKENDDNIKSKDKNIDNDRTLSES